MIHVGRRDTTFLVLLFFCLDVYIEFVDIYCRILLNDIIHTVQKSFLYIIFC